MRTNGKSFSCFYPCRCCRLFLLFSFLPACRLSCFLFGPFFGLATDVSSGNGGLWWSCSPCRWSASSVNSVTDDGVVSTVTALSSAETCGAALLLATVASLTMALIRKRLPWRTNFSNMSCFSASVTCLTGRFNKRPMAPSQETSQHQHDNTTTTTKTIGDWRLAIVAASGWAERRNSLSISGTIN